MSDVMGALSSALARTACEATGRQVRPVSIAFNWTGHAHHNPDIAVRVVRTTRTLVFVDGEAGANGEVHLAASGVFLLQAQAENTD